MKVNRLTNVYLKLKLPFCLYLKDGLYKLHLPEISTTEQVLIVLTKFRRPKEKIDYVTFWSAELTDYGELWNDPNGTFRRSAATVILPHTFAQTPIDSSRREYYEDFPQLMEAAVTALNRLVEIYRFITEDTYLPIIQVIDVYNTFEIGNCLLNSDGSIQYSGFQGGFDNRLTNTRMDYDDDTHRQIDVWLSNGQAIPLFEQLMMDTHFHLQNRNWRSAIIEVQTAFEVFINHKIRDYYLKSGSSKTKVDNIMECGLKNLIEHHLQKATGRPFTESQAGYDSWHKDTYMLRNQVVHNGYLPSEQEATQAVLGVENAFSYLVNREKKKFWKKIQPPTSVNEFFMSDD